MCVIDGMHSWYFTNKNLGISDIQDVEPSTELINLSNGAHNWDSGMCFRFLRLFFSNFAILFRNFGNFFTLFGFFLLLFCNFREFLVSLRLRLIWLLHGIIVIMWKFLGSNGHFFWILWYC